MSNIIVDRFFIKEPSFADVCDSSLDPFVVNKNIKEYNDRCLKESIYRMLYNLGIIAENGAYINLYNEKDGVVYFELNFEKFLKTNPDWKEIDTLRKVFNDRQINLWYEFLNQ